MFSFDITKINELLNFSEDFIYNKEEADIDKIQEMLVFSTIFGKETFYNLERFYKYGDEKNIYNDYYIQHIGKEYFQNNPYLLENIKIELSSIKNLRNLFLDNYLLLDETEIYELKIFILKYKKIIELFKSTSIPLQLYSENVEEILNIIDPFNKYTPTFFLNPQIDTDYCNLLNQKNELINKLKIEEKNELLKLKNEFNIDFSFENPKIILKEDQIYNIIKDKSNLFQILEENYIFVKILPKKSENILNFHYKIQEIEKLIYEKKIEIIDKISKKIFENKSEILKAYFNIGIIDSFITKVSFAIQINGIIPEIDYENFVIEEGTNIYLKNTLSSKGLNYTPISINLSKGVSIITGANMGGKTCLLKTIAQIAYLVHAGLMVPAKKVKIPLFNGIFISGPEKTLVQEGLSSFGYEIFTLKNIWKEKDNFFLFLFDEPAKGTNPIEGKAIVKTISYFLSKSNSFSLISTHYDGIWENINCKKFRIKGIEKNKITELINIIKNKNKYQEINLTKEIFELIDHSVIEVFDEFDVPKNAITLLSLFSFDDEFIKKCNEFLNEQK